LRIKRGIRNIIGIICFAIIIISQWGLWEAVIKPAVFSGARYHDLFPSPFYLWSWPLWLWNDLFLSLTVFASIILTVVLCGFDCDE